MASPLERLYAVMPVALQNIVVTLKGYSFARKRYSGLFNQYLDKLMRSQWSSADEFRNLQNTKLRELLTEAAEHVPYYKKTLSGLKGRIDRLTLDSLCDIPLLEKDVLRTRTAEFVNKTRLRFGYTGSHTSGTSGSPLNILCDYRSIQHNLAFRARQYRWAGITGWEVSARFSGRLILGCHNRAPFCRYNAAERQWLFSTYHMTEQNLLSYVNELAKIQPAYMDSYPSAMYVLARWIKNNGRVGEIRPWAILTTAETLDDYQRDLIESVFCCPVYDFYSSSEGAPFITQCVAGGYHINPESGIVEIIRPDGSPAASGEIGELVVTSFFQRTVPLIRYRIGDTAVATDGICPCGRQMPLVKSLTGRQDDLLWTRDRGYVGRLDPVFKSIPSSIKEAQIVQTALDIVELRYVPEKSTFKKKHVLLVCEQLKNRLGKNVQIKTVELAEIPRGKNAKFRAVVREVNLPGASE
jgi:phenylacetate-CoA ligase